MKKKLLRRAVFGIAVLLTAAIFTLAACGEDPEGGITGGHTHTYSTEWSYNATQHWHECTSGDGAKADIANHDGAQSCSICGWSLFALKFPEAQVYETEYDDDPGVDKITGAMSSGITTPVTSLRTNGNSIDISDNFTGNAAITNGKFAADLTLSVLNDFNDFYKNGENNICDAAVKGFILEDFNEDDYRLFLVKTDAEGVVTHRIYSMYVDTDLTFLADTYYLELTGISVKKGWNYIQQASSNYDCERITDISACKWINYD